MAINRYRENNFPVKLTWNSTGKHIVRIENAISSINVGTTKNLYSVRIGQAIKKIDNDCFSDCSNLSSISFAQPFVNSSTGENVPGTTIDDIGDRAFLSCSSLSAVKFNGDIVTNRIGQKAFANSAISSMTVTTKYIDDYAFTSCKNLKTLNINVDNNIGTEAFSYCPLLNSAAVNAKNIGKHAFSESQLTSVALTADLVEGKMFYNCTNLKQTNITCKTINLGAFHNCTNLTSINLNGTEVINLDIGTMGVDRIDFSAQTMPLFTHDQMIQGWYSEYANDNTIAYNRIPQFISTFGFGLFTNCSELTSFVFPSTLKAINVNPYKFYQPSSSQRFVTIPTSAIPMFVGCNRLRDIWFDIVPDDIEDDQAAVDDFTSDFHLKLYENIFSYIKTSNSDSVLNIHFNDTYLNTNDVLTDQARNSILDRLIEVTLATNYPGKVVFHFKEGTFDPSAADTLLTFSETSFEQILTAKYANSSIRSIGINDDASLTP